jgi:hypothetical protein
MTSFRAWTVCFLVIVMDLSPKDVEVMDFASGEDSPLSFASGEESPESIEDLSRAPLPFSSSDPRPLFRGTDGRRPNRAIRLFVKDSPDTQDEKEAALTMGESPIDEDDPIPLNRGLPVCARRSFARDGWFSIASDVGGDTAAAWRSDPGPSAYSPGSGVEMTGLASEGTSTL